MTTPQDSSGHELVAQLFSRDDVPAAGGTDVPPAQPTEGNYVPREGATPPKPPANDSVALIRELFNNNN
jgi:hypothetical protein